ncbi:MAG: hypothetical protein CR988_05430 [Treponema sp.]|nr:MAG: hypothetical protein CR988_05430 [Treponema sp.]
MSDDLKQAQKLIDSKLFADFLKPDIDRCEFICSFLKAAGVPFKIVNLQTKKHIIVKYDDNCYTEEFKKKTLVAHYDRAENTEGANDNSAACLQLMLFSVKLAKEKKTHNIKIIFTDGEEAGADGITNQGSFLLGTALRKLNFHKAEDIFVFDLCGKGDCLIISQSGIFCRDTQKTDKLVELHKTCCRFAELAKLDYLSIPTPYSDNAGFIATGTNAQVITILPKNEAIPLTQYLHGLPNTKMPKKSVLLFENQTDSEFAHILVTNTRPTPGSKFSKIIPSTWQTIHSKTDCKSKLTAEAFVIIQKFLNIILSQNYK